MKHPASKRETKRTRERRRDRKQKREKQRVDFHWNWNCGQQCDSLQELFGADRWDSKEALKQKEAFYVCEEVMIQYRRQAVALHLKVTPNEAQAVLQRKCSSENYRQKVFGGNPANCWQNRC